MKTMKISNEEFIEKVCFYCRGIKGIGCDIYQEGKCHAANSLKKVGVEIEQQKPKVIITKDQFNDLCKKIDLKDCPKNIYACLKNLNCIDCKKNELKDFFEIKE